MEATVSRYTQSFHAECYLREICATVFIVPTFEITESPKWKLGVLDHIILYNPALQKYRLGAPHKRFTASGETEVDGIINTVSTFVRLVMKQGRQLGGLICLASVSCQCQW